LEYIGKLNNDNSDKYKIVDLLKYIIFETNKKLSDLKNRKED